MSDDGFPSSTHPRVLIKWCLGIPRATWEPEMDAHHWLILHGRYTCKARTPLCGTCIVSDLCGWKERFDYGVANPMVES